mmetsp:Transcript_21119/g.81985  ORF Transcript_21119/g.81985 Transcript_21119/m.81985 type:complete len:520 (-) Transcript_21119:321-1880(-)
MRQQPFRHRRVVARLLDGLDELAHLQRLLDVDRDQHAIEQQGRQGLLERAIGHQKAAGRQRRDAQRQHALHQVAGKHQAGADQAEDGGKDVSHVRAKANGCRSTSGRRQGKHVNLAALALELHRPERQAGQRIAELLARGGVEQHCVAGQLGVRLQPRGDVHGVADAGVGRAAAGAGVAGHHIAAGHADADAHLGLAQSALLLAELRHHLDHLGRRQQRAAPRRLQRLGRAEHGHQPVADHLVDHAAMLVDGREHQRVVGVEQLDDVLRRLRLDQAGEAADVAEHHRGLGPATAERKALGLQVLGHLAGRKAPHQLALLVAQPLALQRRADARLQQHQVHRLAQIVLGPQLDAAHHAVHALQRRSDDDRQLAQLGVLTQALEQLKAVQPRHVDVHQHEVKGLLLRPLQRGQAVLDHLDLVAQQLHMAGQQQAVDAVVIRQQHAGRAGTPLTHGSAPAAPRPPRRTRPAARRPGPSRRRPAPPAACAPAPAPPRPAPACRRCGRWTSAYAHADGRPPRHR